MHLPQVHADINNNISDIESSEVNIWQQTFQTFLLNVDGFRAYKVLVTLLIVAYKLL